MGSSGRPCSPGGRIFLYLPVSCGISLHPGLCPKISHCDA